MIVGILGQCDKRVLMYPLLKVLELSGDVIIITDNSQFKRLIDGDDYGHYHNTLICVTDLSPEEVWEDIEYNEDDFDHVIYDLKYYVPPSVDKVIYVYTVEKNPDDLDLLEILDDYNEVKLIYGKPTRQEKKEGKYIPLTMRDLYAVEYAEVVQLPNYLNIHLINKLYEITNDFLNIPKKQFIGIMKKEGI